MGGAERGRKSRSGHLQVKGRPRGSRGFRPGGRAVWRVNQMVTPSDSVAPPGIRCGRAELIEEPVVPGDVPAPVIHVADRRSRARNGPTRAASVRSEAARPRTRRWPVGGVSAANLRRRRQQAMSHRRGRGRRRRGYVAGPVAGRADLPPRASRTRRSGRRRARSATPPPERESKQAGENTSHRSCRRGSRLVDLVQDVVAAVQRLSSYKSSIRPTIRVDHHALAPLPDMVSGTLSKNCGRMQRQRSPLPRPVKGTSGAGEACGADRP
jgi:hypothetical protein